MTLEAAGSARGTKNEGYCVGVVGASSLLGKELVAVLKEREFPVSRLLEIEAGLDAALEPELPIIDLDKAEPVGSSRPFNPEVRGDELDIAFVAVRPDPLPAFFRPQSSRPPLIIDLDRSLAALGQAVPRIARLDQEALSSGGLSGEPTSAMVASAHPATIVLSSLLLRLASQVEITTAVAQIFSPASQLGVRAIDELQRQTVNLLSFQKIPRAIFGFQLAFNLLPRLTGSGSEGLSCLENRLRGELEKYLAGRVPLPALKLFQAPVFYSLAASLYVET
ncbi:MAG TPA: hypothetical protein VI455_17680, partial [Terriglobia bacterium]